MSDATLGHGAILELCDTTNFTVASNVTTIGNISSIGGPSHSRDSLDISTMDSADKWREFIPGMLDSGEITLDVNYDGSASGDGDALNSLQTNGTQYYKIYINDHTTKTSKSNFLVKGFLTSLGTAIPFDDKITQSATIKLSGAPVYVDLAS